MSGIVTSLTGPEHDRVANGNSVHEIAENDTLLLCVYIPLHMSMIFFPKKSIILIHLFKRLA